MLVPAFVSALLLAPVFALPSLFGFTSVPALLLAPAFALPSLFCFTSVPALFGLVYTPNRFAYLEFAYLESKSPLWSTL